MTWFWRKKGKGDEGRGKRTPDDDDTVYATGSANRAFHRDDNTPQIVSVYGRCKKCKHEGNYEVKMYNDGSTYSTCPHCHAKDSIEQIEGGRRQQADRPLEGWNDPVRDSDYGNKYTQGRDPLTGRQNQYVSKRYCGNCRTKREVTIVEEVETGNKTITCNHCGRFWKETRE